MDDPASEKQAIPVEETPIIDEKSGEVVHTPETGVSYDTTDVVPEAAQMFGQTHQSVPASVEPPPAVHSAEHAPEPSAPSPKPPQKTRKFHAGSVIFIVLLFGLGMWLSLELRSFFTADSSSPVVVPTTAPEAVSPEPTSTAATSSASTNTQWTVYTVVSGITRTAVPGVSYKLPGTVTAPVCDSSACPSQGTNLPGGTRFTVAPRGKGQLLPDFRGAILTDASGKEFTMQQTTIGGIYAYEYSGDFTGRTGGGYTFTKMRGVLIPVNDSLAVEFNHFAPEGANSDYASDDTLFNAIVATFSSAAPIPTATAAPTATPSAY